MDEVKFRNIYLYKNYFTDFFTKQSQKVKDKILWTFKVIETMKFVPIEYLKHIEGQEGLYEIRVQAGNDIFRIFCFFERNKLIVLMNGFRKKTQKTPIKEINKALKIKEEYKSEKK